VTSRGCPFSCDFCTVTVFNGPRLRRRPPEDVVSEIEAIPQSFLLFLDDNLIGHSRRDREQAKELFSEIIRRGVRKRWACQTSIDSLVDDSVLRLAKKSGCFAFFVGMESRSGEALARMAKSANLHVGPTAYESCIERVHRNGILVAGNFILLTPHPGTRLYEWLEREVRIVRRTGCTTTRIIWSGAWNTSRYRMCTGEFAPADMRSTPSARFYGVSCEPLSPLDAFCPRASPF
jgi:hypothetical protein